MITPNLVKIKMSAKKAEFKHLVGLTPGNNVELLKSFCLMMHPKSDATIENNKCSVFTGRNSYTYSLYTTCILRTTFDGFKTIYSL